MSKKVIPQEKYPVLVFDIETKTNPKAIAILDDPKPPKNLVDPAKIKAAIEEKKQEQVELAPLDSDLGLIACIGYSVGLSGEIVVDVVNKKMSEKQVLENFWHNFAVCDGRCTGYNILNFDLPYIMKRSFDLGVRPSMLPNLAKYRTQPVTDLQMLLCGWDYRNAHKFKWVCKRYGIEILDEGVDGSMVKDMSDTDLKKYCHSDVNATKLLYKRMEGYYF